MRQGYAGGRALKRYHNLVSRPARHPSAHLTKTWLWTSTWKRTLLPQLMRVRELNRELTRARRNFREYDSLSRQLQERSRELLGSFRRARQWQEEAMEDMERWTQRVRTERNNFVWALGFTMAGSGVVVGAVTSSLFWKKG